MYCFIWFERNSGRGEFSAVNPVGHLGMVMSIKLSDVTKLAYVTLSFTFMAKATRYLKEIREMNRKMIHI